MIAALAFLQAALPLLQDLVQLGVALSPLVEEAFGVVGRLLAGEELTPETQAQLDAGQAAMTAQADAAHAAIQNA
jgi:hypothetical protein